MTTQLDLAHRRHASAAGSAIAKTRAAATGLTLVVVLCDDGRREKYWFRRETDALKSIRTTWSRVEGFRLAKTPAGYRAHVGDRRVAFVLPNSSLPEVLDGPTRL